MLASIRNKLITGSVKSVVVFGSDMPKTRPYVVIKPEALPIGRGIRIIPHFDKNRQLEISDYTFNEVSTLLNGFSFTDANGNHNVIEDADEYLDITVDNDDGTISMERLFYVPSRLY